MSESKPKSFEISKRAVWNAWLRVKANKGAAGVDEQSISEFEANLTGNLYKLWNRLSSGSYFPPPVLAVAIPKRDGGSRVLGIPTVTLYRVVVQRVFWFVGGDASVSPACGGVFAGLVRASFCGFACVCVRGRAVGECVVARGCDGSWWGAGFGPVDGGGARRARGCGGRDRWVAGGGEGLLMLCANRAQDGGRRELQRVECFSAAGAAAALGAVGGGSAGDAAWNVAASGQALRSRGVPLRAGRVAWPVPVSGNSRGWGRPVNLRAGGDGGNGRCTGRSDSAARGCVGGDFTYQPGAVAPAGAGVMGGRRDGWRGVSCAGQHAGGGARGERGR